MQSIQKVKFTKKEKMDMLETNFKGSVVCSICGQDHTYDGLEFGGKCNQCNNDLTKELF